MELSDDFRLAMPVEQAWAILRDLAEVARWVPGATVGASDDGVVSGSVAVKVGPVTATFDGVAEITRIDEELHQVTITASGEELGDADHAPSVVVLTVTVRERRDGCQVDVHARADVKGRVARFGESVLGEVSSRTLQRVADELRRGLDLAPPRPATARGPPADRDPHPGHVRGRGDVGSTQRTPGSLPDAEHPPRPTPTRRPAPTTAFDLDEPEPEPERGTGTGTGTGT